MHDALAMAIAAKSKAIFYNIGRYHFFDGDRILEAMICPDRKCYRYVEVI
jgi:hypothetical protein